MTGEDWSYAGDCHEWGGLCVWWTYDPGDSYRTACKHDACFVNENAREQGYRYCPWCGRRIEWKKGGRR